MSYAVTKKVAGALTGDSNARYTVIKTDDLSLLNAFCSTCVT